MKIRDTFLAPQKTFLQYYSVLLIMLIWEILSRLGVMNSVLLPPISKIGVRFLELLFFEKLLYHTGQSMFRMWVGLGLAVLVGVPLGIVMARFALARSLLEPLLGLGFPIPKNRNLSCPDHCFRRSPFVQDRFDLYRSDLSHRHGNTERGAACRTETDLVR